MFEDMMPKPPPPPVRKKPKRDERGRWLKGSSGNEDGRPRQHDTIGFDENAHVFGKGIVEIKVAGKITPMTRGEALNHKLYQQAMNGNDTRALLALKKEIEKDNAVISSLIANSLNLIPDMQQAKSDDEREDINNRIQFAIKALESAAQQIAVKNATYNRMTTEHFIAMASP